MKLVLFVIRLLLALFILLLSIATLMGGAYFQTLLFWAIAVIIMYWPKAIAAKFGVLGSVLFRFGALAILFVSISFIMQGDEKKSIYINVDLHEELMSIYDQKLKKWPESTQEIDINTKYGRVHVLACGNPANPPLLMFHAASMGAHSWAENLPAVIDNYRVYAVDNPGEGNKSQLNDVLVFPETSKEIADLYAEIADSLGVDRSIVFGASNGGYIAQSYSYYYPNSVEKLALFGPMGITQLSGANIMMMTLATLYPFDFVREMVSDWAIGRDQYSKKLYGDWFDCIMRSTIPSIAGPVPMTTAQKNMIKIPVILFLGTEDPIVGDAEMARKAALDYPNIEIEVLKSGHLIAVEHDKYINKKMMKFLKK